VSRSLALLALLCAFSSSALSDDLVVKGNVDASWGGQTLVSPAQDAIVHAGDSVTVTLTGKIDINQDTQHSTHCDAWVFCHDESTPIHNFRTPDQVPVRFEVRQVGGGPVVASAVVGASPKVLAIPISDAVFETAYEIVALLEGTGTYIVPGRSGGSYNVVLDIEASGRAGYFQQWLNQVHPSATRATGPLAIADDVRTKGNVVAAALRQYASGSYPVPNAANSDSHGILVKKAVEIAPGDVENTLALARYLRAIGLDAQADAELAKAVATLENLTDPHSRRQLGDAYMSRMSAALSKGGGIDRSSSQAALSFADNAIKAYGQAERPDLVSSAEFTRGRLLRGMRTPESLLAATDAFKLALAEVADVVGANSVLQSSDGGKTFAVRIADTVSLSSITDGRRPIDPALTDQQPIAWDPVRQQLLVWGNGGLTWLSQRLDSPMAAPAVSPGFLQVGNGAILRMKDGQSVDYFSSDQIATPLPVAGPNAFSCTAPAPFVGSGIYGMTLSRDGAVAAVICNNTLRVFVNSAGGISQVAEKTQPASVPPNSVFAVAGPATCGTVVVSLPTQGKANAVLTLLRGGREIKLTEVPVGSPLFMSVDRVNFAADDVLVARSSNEIAKFHCSDGGSDGAIALPPVSDAMFGRVFPMMYLRWLNTDQLAVVRTWARSVDVINWSTQKSTHFDPHADISSLDLQTQLLLPPATGLNSPRLLTPHRKSEITEHPSAAARAVVKLDVPGGWESIFATPDSSHLLVQRPGSPTWIAENKVDPKISEGATDEVALDTFGLGSGWIAAKVDDTSHVLALRTTDASGAEVPVPLPAVPSTYYPTVISALQSTYDSWQKIPGAPEFPGMFQNKDLPTVIANQGLLSVAYHVQASGFTATSIFSSPFSPSTLPPLSSSKGRSAVTLCATPVARTAPSAPTLLIPGFLPDQLFLGTEAAGALTFKAIPDPTFPPLPPGVIRPMLCAFEQLVRGTSPTLVYLTFFPSGPKLQILMPGGWLSSNISQAPAAGWSTPSGDIFLLLPDAAPPGQAAAKFSLVRVDSTGTSVSACDKCAGLPLLDEFRSITPSSTAVLNPSQMRSVAGGPVSMMLMDEKGRVLALPADDETVVLSLVDGRVLKRVPLGRPLTLSEHQLTISSDGKRTAFYSY
jgi:hypothetical protein